MEIFLIITGVVLLLAGRRLYWLLVGWWGLLLAIPWRPIGLAIRNYGLFANRLTGRCPVVHGLRTCFSTSDDVSGRFPGWRVGFACRWSLVKAGEQFPRLGDIFGWWSDWIASGGCCFRLGVILLSTIGGALLITENIELSSNISMIATIGLVVVGILVQRKLFHH